MGASQFRSDARSYSIANARLQRRIASLERALNDRDSRIESLNRQLENAVRTIQVLRNTVFREIKDIRGSLTDMQQVLRDSPNASQNEPRAPFEGNVRIDPQTIR